MNFKKWMALFGMLSFPAFADAEAGGLADPGVLGFKAVDIDGKEQALEQYRGKAILIVNTASKCGYTPQYKGLQALYAKYKDQGLVVLGFPSNDFLHQEPGSSAEIKEFCSLKFHVTFPMFEKIDVKGKNIHPLYRYLTQQSPYPGDISWNFNKFLAGRDGNLLARWGSKTTPEDPELVKAVEQALGL
jgi:glutathione peroxidase